MRVSRSLETVLRAREDAHSARARARVSDVVMSVRDRVPSPPRAAPAQPSQLAPDPLSDLPVPLCRVVDARQPPQVAHQGPPLPLLGLPLLVQVQQRAQAPSDREGPRARIRTQPGRKYPRRRRRPVRARVAVVDPAAAEGGGRQAAGNRDQGGRGRDSSQEPGRRQGRADGSGGRLDHDQSRDERRRSREAELAATGRRSTGESAQSGGDGPVHRDAVPRRTTAAATDDDQIAVRVRCVWPGRRRLRRAGATHDDVTLLGDDVIGSSDAAEAPMAG